MIPEILPSLPRAEPSRLPELMDRPDADPEALRDALETLARANRRFGTRRMVRRPALAIPAPPAPVPVRVLDVGTGSGDIGLSVARGLLAGGREVRLVVADAHRRTLRIARERIRSSPGDGGPSPEVSSVRLTAPRLPFRDGAFDVAVSSTMLHHLERTQAADFLRDLDRVSAGRWIVTDLRRSRTAYWAIRLLAATLWRRHPYPRRDGPVSVRRAFTAPEVRDLLARADLPGATVERKAPFRLRLRGRRARGAA